MIMDKPFSCPVSDCNMTFANEDHLTVHKKKHELSLTLTPTSAFKNLFTDQTPTPTRFLNALEPELFQDFHTDNPFDATFRKANSSNSVSHSFVIPESSSLIASLPDSDALNTPSITLPSEPETPVVLKHNFLKKFPVREQDNQTNGESTDTLPFIPNEQSNQNIVSQQALNTDDLNEENANFDTISTASLSVFTDPDEVNVQKRKTVRTSVVQTPVITSVGTVLKTNAVGLPTTVGVPTAVVVTRGPASTISTLTPTQVSVVTEQPSHPKVPEVAQPVVQSVCVTPMVQLMIRLPDGQTMPVQIPVMASAPAVTQPAQTVSSVAPEVTTTSSVAKMKLKEVLTMNQKSANSGKKCNPNGKTKSKTVQILPDSLEGFGLSLSPPSSPTAQQRPGHSSRKRRELTDDPDEKRKRSLERNRAAATRCREKRKQWITALERKAVELSNTNSQLQQEVTQLRNEVAHLKTLLLAHKDCPVTLQQKASGYEADREAFTTIRIITSSTDDVQHVPNVPTVSPLNADFMEMEVSSVQSSSDASLTSDTSETSYKDR